MRLTPAWVRVLEKTRAQGFLMAAGGVGGDNPMTSDEAIEDEQFDRAPVIWRMVAAGLMSFGDYANQYVLTEAGHAVLAKHDRLRRKNPAESPAADQPGVDQPSDLAA
jgi:hypothetical protein